MSTIWGQLLHDRLSSYLNDIADVYRAECHIAFGVRPEALSEFSLRVLSEGHTNLLNGPYEATFGPRRSRDFIGVALRKDANSDTLKLSVFDSDAPVEFIRFCLVKAICKIVFDPIMPRAHISSAERTGAAIFRNELDFARSRMVRAVMDADSKQLKKLGPKVILEDAKSRYAWPVEDSVDFVRELEAIDREASVISTSHPDIIRKFNELIGGSYEVDENGVLAFRFNSAGERRFSMNEASSCARALLDVGFYLRCVAQPGDLFIIDEPELNLHPKNQRAFARLIARLVNAGVKVMITTHSDYIVKEINSLIMLARRTEHTTNVQKDNGYDDEELLSPNSVRLYTTVPCASESSEATLAHSAAFKLEAANIDPIRGIECTTFDETIGTMNDIQEAILFEGDD